MNSNYIDSLCDDLQQQFSCKRIGDIQYFYDLRSHTSGSDIDFLSKNHDLRKMGSYLVQKGFVVEDKFSGIGFTARKCVEGKIYHLDISSQPIQNHWFPGSIPTPKLLSAIYEDRDLERFFRYVLSFRFRGRYREHLVNNAQKYFDLLRDPLFLNKNPLRRSAKAVDLIGLAKGDRGKFFKVFTISGLLGVFWSYAEIQLQKIRHRRGRVVAFLGPDGSGKTTTMEALGASLGAHTMYFGDSQFRFQKVYERFFGLRKPLIYVPYLFMYLEQWFRLLNILFKKYKGEVVFTDRWPGYNQNLFKSMKNRRLFLVLYSIFPDPDEFILLEADASTIVARKDELTELQILTYYAEVKLKLKNKKLLTVGTDGYDDTINQIFKHFTKSDKPLIRNFIPQPTIIEFSGIYASGKTSTAKSLAEDLSSQGYVIKTNSDLWEFTSSQSKLNRRIKYLCSVEMWRFATMGLLRRPGASSVKLPKRRLLKHLTGPARDIIDRKRFCRSVKADFVIFDEGSVYVTMDLLWKYSLPIKKIDTYLGKLPYAEMSNFFVFKPEAETSLERTKLRKSTSLIDKESDDVRSHAISELLPYCLRTNNYVLSRLNGTELTPEEDMSSRIQRVKNELGVRFVVDNQ